MLLALVLACAGPSKPDDCLRTTAFVDADGDGHGAGLGILSCDADPTLVASNDDCDDQDASVGPDAVERCNAIDDDCDGETDEPDAIDAGTSYADLDVDGYGDPASPLTACVAPVGSRGNADDCDDADPLEHPGAEERCDGQDDDCDGTIDEQAIDAPLWLPDGDGDGHPGDGPPLAGCTAPPGYGAMATDCDDTDPARYPGAPEHCDGRDEDCDVTIDEDAVDSTRWYTDRDGDGYGTGGGDSCVVPAGGVLVGDDCNDGQDYIHPGAGDVPANAVDEDCDGTYACYTDADGDRYGTSAFAISADNDCADAGESARDDDCDDTDATVAPNLDEVAYDGVDQDCDGLDLSDADEDGWDATAAGGTDCDDADPAVSPAATERCDDVDLDEDCDGLADDADPDLGGAIAWYLDADGDGAGDPATASTSVCAPSDTVRVGDDCDDADPSVRPLATESCDDTTDRNCDGEIGAGDADGDGTIACEDCDDQDPAAHPGAIEVSNAADDDCDHLPDEWEGDLTVESEADAEALCASYAAVEGDLVITGLSSLRSLDCLRVVSGDLRFDRVSATDFSGLEQLEEVGADLMIGGWKEATGVLTAGDFGTLDGLDRLARVGGDLWIAGIGATDLSGAPRLDTVGGSLILWDLPLDDATVTLTSLGGDLWLEDLPWLGHVEAPSLVTFGGSLWIQESAQSSGGFSLDWALEIPGALGLQELPVGVMSPGWSLPITVGALYVIETDLAALDGLADLQTIEGELSLFSNPDLVDLHGLDGVTAVGGGLLVEGYAGSVLDSFPGLASIGGRLQVEGGGLTTLRGFDALESIGTALQLRDLPRLTSITGLGAVERCADLVIENAALTDLSGLGHIPFEGDVHLSQLNLLDLRGLESVERLSGTLKIEDVGLITLDGLESLRTIGGALDLERLDGLVDTSALAGLTGIEGAVVLSELAALPTLSLSGLSVVGGDFAIDELAVVTALDLPALTAIGGGLTVSSAPWLVDLHGLDALESVAGSLTLESNGRLASLSGLDALTTVGADLIVRDNAQLASLAGLGALQTVGQDLTLQRNGRLTRPDSLGALTLIGWDLWVEENPLLVDLGGMGSFAVGNGVWIHDNAALTSLDGLGALSTVPAQLALTSLPQLSDLSALGALSAVGTGLRIGDCGALTDLRGLDALETVWGDLEIGNQRTWTGWSGGNGALTALTGLGGLRAVGGTLWIDGNRLLTDITALEALETVGADLGVVDNVTLLTADAMALADGTPVVEGTVSIYGNR